MSHGICISTCMYQAVQGEHLFVYFPILSGFSVAVCAGVCLAFLYLEGTLNWRIHVTR